MLWEFKQSSRETETKRFHENCEIDFRKFRKLLSPQREFSPIFVQNPEDFDVLIDIYFCCMQFLLIGDLVCKKLYHFTSHCVRICRNCMVSWKNHFEIRQNLLGNFIKRFFFIMKMIPNFSSNRKSLQKFFRNSHQLFRNMQYYSRLEIR